MEEYFNTSLPISYDNEVVVVEVLVGGLEGMRRGYRGGTVEEEEALLALSTVVERTPVKAAAVRE